VGCADEEAGADGNGTREFATALLPAGDYSALLLAQPPAGPAGTWITLDSATTTLEGVMYFFDVLA